MTQYTIAQCLQQSAELQTLSDSPRLDVELILCQLLHKNRTWLFTWSDKTLTVTELEQFQKMFARRKAGEPIAHILGRREFWSLPLRVNNSTLIPRPDTELIVEMLLELFAQDDAVQSRNCLDLGTGTGAIALAIASEKKHWQILAVDFSANAVALAQENRADLGFDHVHIQQSDWFAQIPAQQFDVILSNPPYIDPQDPHLEQGDVRFEPRSALIAANKGMADIEHIIAQAPRYLTAGGYLLLEHGYDQGEAVRALLNAHQFTQLHTRRDYGGNERITRGQWPGENRRGE
jgi:release factor glutamine methyltransferase